MDGRDFDNLLRSFTESRRTVLAGSLAALGAALGVTPVLGKKRKKKCAKKCADGCCTGKRGTCIRPAQQNATQCGTGGEICRTNCGGGGGDTCGATCATCCANGDCIDPAEISNAQCGFGGEACFACPADQSCDAGVAGCCARKGAACGGSGAPCCTIGGTLRCGSNSTCCVPSATTAGSGFAFCDGDQDCCDPIDVCQDGRCKRPEGATCQPGNLLCESPLICNASGICATCPGDQEYCDGVCCPMGQNCYGTVCCPLNFGCAGVNNGQGSCCQFEYCCEPIQPGVCDCEFPNDGCCG